MGLGLFTLTGHRHDNKLATMWNKETLFRNPGFELQRYTPTHCIPTACCADYWHLSLNGIYTCTVTEVHSQSHSKPPPPVLVDVQFLSSWNGANRLQLTTLLAVYIPRRLMDWGWLPTHLSLYTWKLECDWWDRPTTLFIGMSWIRQGWACEMYDSNQLVSSQLYFWQEFWVVHCDTFGEVSPISIHWL